MDESMNIWYFLSIFILGFIIIHTQGQDQTTIDRIQIIANNTNSVITTPTRIIPSTSVSTTIIIATSLYTESTISKTTTIMKTTTITPTLPVYARPTPPLNPTWIIIGGFAGGLTAIGLLGVVAGIYICYENSRRRIESASETSTDQDTVPLYIVSSF